MIDKKQLLIELLHQKIQNTNNELHDLKQLWSHNDNMFKTVNSLVDTVSLLAAMVEAYLQDAGEISSNKSEH